MANNTGLQDPHLRTLIDQQHGVLSAKQAVSNGLSRETMRRHVLRGLWQRPVPGVYALQGGPPNRLQWLIAAQLYAGEGSVLTGRATLSVYGLEVDPPEPTGAPAAIDPPTFHLHALVPHRTRRQNVGSLRITRTTRVPAPTRFGVLRVAPLARSVVDSCLASVEDGDAASIDKTVTAALADGRVSLAELEYELDHTTRKHSGLLRTELAKLRTHERAAASSKLLDKIRVSGPRGVMLDVAIYMGTVRVSRAAAVWPSRAVAVLVDAPEREIRALTALGFAVVNVQPRQVDEDAGGLLRHISNVLATRPEATLAAGISLLPLASAYSRDLPGNALLLSAHATNPSGRASLAPAHSANPPSGSPAPSPHAPNPLRNMPAFSAHSTNPPARASALTAHPTEPPAPGNAPVLPLPQRVLTASSPARTGVSSVLPRGGTGHT